MDTRQVVLLFSSFIEPVASVSGQNVHNGIQTSTAGQKFCLYADETPTFLQIQIQKQ